MIDTRTENKSRTPNQIIGGYILLLAEKLESKPLDTKSVVFDNLVLKILEELKEQNPALSETIEEVIAAHVGNICERDYHIFSMAKKLNMPPKLFMYMAKAQEWDLEKEFIHLIMLGFDTKTIWKHLHQYHLKIEETRESGATHLSITEYLMNLPSKEVVGGIGQ